MKEDTTMERILSAKRTHWQEAPERGMRDIARRRGRAGAMNQSKNELILSGQLLEQEEKHI